MRVIVTEGVAAQFGDELRTAAPGADFILLRNDGAWEGDAATAEAAYLSVDSLVSGSAEVFERDFAKFAALRWVHTFSIGLDWPIFRTVFEAGVTLTNGAGTQSQPIAQYVILMMLYHAKGMANWLANQQEHRWQRFASQELTGKTVALYGVGGIGSEVAKICKAMGMEVVGLRRRQEPVPFVDELLPPEKVNELCARADYLVICAPYTAATRGVIGREQFALMKPTAVLINVARGPLVEEGALVGALRDNRIAGAALDVFDQEPLPADHPLWDLPNVVISPHMSPSSPLHIVRGTRLFIENLRRYVVGEALLNRITNPEDVGAGVEGGEVPLRRI